MHKSMKQLLLAIELRANSSCLLLLLQSLVSYLSKNVFDEIHVAENDPSIDIHEGAFDFFLQGR